MSFSQRYGFKPIRDILQRDSMDSSLRTTLWNALYSCYWYKAEDFHYDSLDEDNTLRGLVINLWLFYFKKPLDSMSPLWSKNIIFLRDYFFKCQWFEVYDFIELVAQDQSDSKDFITICNNVLEREMSAYRFVNKHITEITSENEITEIEDAISNSSQIKTVQLHLQTALTLMADKKQPDYRNSIKESISAVESICKIITQNQSATLGQALNQIEKTGQVVLHSALKDGYSKLYGYTNDADGIRHALKDQSSVAFEDAKYMLVSCSAFINYLISKSIKAGINLN